MRAGRRTIGSTDWATTAAKFRDLLNEWKVGGPGLEGRSTKPCGSDSKRRRTNFSPHATRSVPNVTPNSRPTVRAKEKLLAEAEKIDIANLDAARATLRTITDKWDAIGNAPRDRAADLDRRLRAVEKKIRDASDTQRADPEALARAEQFRDRAEQFERQAEKAAAAGRTKDAEAGQGQRGAMARVGRYRGGGLDQAALGRQSPVPTRNAQDCPAPYGRRSGRGPPEAPSTGYRQPLDGAEPRRPSAQRFASTPAGPSGRSTESP